MNITTFTMKIFSNFFGRNNNKQPLFEMFDGDYDDETVCQEIIERTWPNYDNLWVIYDNLTYMKFTDVTETYIPNTVLISFKKSVSKTDQKNFILAIITAFKFQKRKLSGYMH